MTELARIARRLISQAERPKATDVRDAIRILLRGDKAVRTALTAAQPARDALVFYRQAIVNNDRAALQADGGARATAALAALADIKESRRG